MTSDQLSGWITVAQVLAAVGINIVDKIKAMIHAAHPDLPQEEIDAAYMAILDDDAVRGALAAQASRPPTGQ